MRSGQDAYLALGSNLGTRESFLRDAVSALGSRPGIVVAARSPVFETDAVAAEPQPAYLNAVLRLETAHAPDTLLAHALDIERTLGRVRPAGHDKAPRTIDIDVLLVGAVVIDRPHLRVPHPALLNRHFVRIPLATVARPGLRHPVTGDALDQAAPDPSVRPFPFVW